MENIVDKSVLKRQWYMMGCRDAAIELLQAFNKKFVTYACVAAIIGPKEKLVSLFRSLQKSTELR